MAALTYRSGQKDGDGICRYPFGRRWVVAGEVDAARTVCGGAGQRQTLAMTEPPPRASLRAAWADAAGVSYGRAAPTRVWVYQPDRGTFSTVLPGTGASMR